MSDNAVSLSDDTIEKDRFMVRSHFLEDNDKRMHCTIRIIRWTNWSQTRIFFKESRDRCYPQQVPE